MYLTKKFAVPDWLGLWVGSFFNEATNRHSVYYHYHQQWRASRSSITTAAARPRTKWTTTEVAVFHPASDYVQPTTQNASVCALPYLLLNHCRGSIFPWCDWIAGVSRSISIVCSCRPIMAVISNYCKSKMVATIEWNESATFSCSTGHHHLRGGDVHQFV